MTTDAILGEVEHLNGVCERLERLAESTPHITTIAGNVRNTATLLAVLVATKLTAATGIIRTRNTNGARRSFPEHLLLT
jgi:hypothetical protein